MPSTTSNHARVIAHAAWLIACVLLAVPTVASARAARSSGDGGDIAAAIDSKEAALRDYDRRRLVRRAVTNVLPYTSPWVPKYRWLRLSWTVMDGGNTAYTAEGFAARIGDRAMVATLQKRRTGAWVAFAAGIAGGIGVVAAGAAVRSSAMEWRDEYHATTGGAQDHARDQFYSLRDLSGAMWVIGGVLAIAGPTILSITLFRQRWTSFFYEPEAVDAAIEVHNGELRESLGLDEDDTLRIDLLARGPGVEMRVVASLGCVGVVGRF